MADALTTVQLHALHRLPDVRNALLNYADSPCDDNAHDLFKLLADHIDKLQAAAAGVALPDGRLTLDAGEVQFLAARLRRLFAHHSYALPDCAKDDASLIEVAGTAIGHVLTNAGVTRLDGNTSDAHPPMDSEPTK